jgi:hypothetical protein
MRPATTPAPLMYDGSITSHHGAVSAGLGPPAQVGILPVQKNRFIEAPELLPVVA